MSVHELSVGYGSTPVLDRVDLRLAAGSVLCVTGENDVGKSTLLRCVTGLIEPDGGTVMVFGERPDCSARYWRRVAATVENPSWYSGLTVREHVELVRLANGADPADGRIEEVFAALGLTHLADSAPDSLSSGQRQRLLLSIVLARPSRLLVLDEPEQRLDTTVKDIVAGHLRAYAESGGSVLMASHDPIFIAAMGGEVLALNRATAALTRAAGAPTGTGTA